MMGLRVACVDTEKLLPGHELAKPLAARLEVAELVKARARRTQQHDLPRASLVRGLLEGALELSALL
jgi:hypothetical protein